MDVVVTLVKLADLVGTIEKVAKLLQGGELERILSTISQVHYQAAQTSLAHAASKMQ